MINFPYIFLTQSYWRDEVFRVFMAKQSWWNIIRLTYDDGQPPFYYYILKIWMWFFRDGEVATRLLSLIFYALLIVVVFFFAKALNPKNKYLPYITVILTLINPSLVYYAFETRVYIFFVLLVTLSSYFAYVNNYKNWIVFSLISLYTNNFMVFVIPFQLLWQRKLIKPAIWVFIGYLPWFFVFIHQAILVKNDFWIAKFNWQSLQTTLSGVYFGYENDPIFLMSKFSLFSLLLLPALLLSLKNKQGRYLMLIFVGPFLTVMILSLLIRTIFLSRYLSFLVIPLTLAISLLFSKMKLKLLIPVLFCMILVLIYVNILLYPVRLKPDIRSSVKQLSSLVIPGDIIYTDSLNYFETKYYFAKFAPSGYTDKVKIIIYSPTGNIPFFVGKVLIPDENVTDKIYPGQRIYKIDQKANFSVFSRG